MNKINQISEAQINAFIDGELDAEERVLLLNESENDEELREILCAYNKQKELLRMAYDDVPRPERKPLVNISTITSNNWLGRSIAASLFMVLGMFLGYAADEKFHRSVPTGSAGDNPAVAEQSENYIIHVVSGDAEKMRVALDDARALVKARNKNGFGKIEVVANEDGLDMLRRDVTPYEHEIQELIDDDVLFFACTRAIKNLEAQGVDVKLTPRVNNQYTALDRLVLRLRQDWNYIKI